MAQHTCIDVYWNSHTTILCLLKLLMLIFCLFPSSSSCSAVSIEYHKKLYTSLIMENNEMKIQQTPKPCSK